MRVLGIETTCDETAAAVVRLRGDGTGEILADEVMSQIAAHSPYGGVVPEIAARAHVEIVDGLIARALTTAGVKAGALDGIAAAAGPGPDRRRAGRADDRQGHGAGDRQAVRRRQPSRGARAGGAARRPARFSLSAAARLRRPYADPRGQGGRRLSAARRDDGRRDRRSVRQDRQAARPALSGRPGGRSGGARGRPRPLRLAAAAARPAKRRFLAVGPEDGDAARRRRRSRRYGRATSPTSAPRSRRRSST